MANGGAISCRSKLQTIVAHSTMEAEYIGLTECAREIIWLRSLLLELGHTQNQPTTLFGDNTASISVAEPPRTHTRSKTIDIRHHAIRSWIETKQIKLEHIRTTEMTADIMTKALQAPDFIKHRASMGLHATLAERIPGGVLDMKC